MQMTDIVTLVVLSIYVDDILLTCSDGGINATRAYTHQHFVFRGGLQTLSDFPRIDFFLSMGQLSLTLSKEDAQDLLQGTMLRGCKLESLPMEVWPLFLGVHSVVL